MLNVIQICVSDQRQVLWCKYGDQIEQSNDDPSPSKCLCRIEWQIRGSYRLLEKGNSSLGLTISFEQMVP